jgi:lipid-binding SYLF domain-containing protein
MMKFKKQVPLIMFLLSAVLFCGCATVPRSKEARAVLSSEVDETIAVFKNRDQDIKRFFDRSYGYAVFPRVFKGAFWIGGAHGNGEVFEANQMIGYSSLSQATLGFSFGGEYFREIVFFRDKEDLDEFKAEEYTFSAQVTGVVLTTGAAAKADYESGKAVFIMTESGLMVDVSLGGQKFNYTPKSLVTDQANM